MLEKIRDFFAEHEERPNKFTRFMGERVRTAREEANMSQEELARIAYLRRATLSDIENGKSEADTTAFVLIAYYLKKPLAYFLPEFLYDEMKREELKPLEQEVLLHFEQIYGDELKKFAIRIVKAFGDFDPQDLIVELAPLIAARMEREKEIRDLQEKRRKKKS